MNNERIIKNSQKDEIVDWTELTLTHRCNQRCFFCYEDSREIAKEPDIDNVKKLLNKTKKKAKLVVLCGKEVLLRRDILSIINYARSLKLHVAVFTNGQVIEKKDFIEQLVAAGCSSIVISFHFPDAEVFTRAARCDPKGFYRQISGIERLREYNLKNSTKQISVSTETDMFILNKGRLKEIRQILINAFGDSPWKMRIGSLLPTKVYDIGLDHILAPLAERYMEIKNFIKSHPSQIPLDFIKVPLCLLPEDEIHRSLDVRYIYEGTFLSYNHERSDEVDVDKISTSLSNDIKRNLRGHPYRWICRKCNLVSLCRYNRVDWHHKFFAPSREQKPTPYLGLKAEEVLKRFGDDEIAIKQVEKVNIKLKRKKYPEEKLIESLDSKNPSDPRIRDVWIENKYILGVELLYNSNIITLQLGIPSRNNNDEKINIIIDYLIINSLKNEKVSKKEVNKCLLFISKCKLPSIEDWKDESWFNLSLSKFLIFIWNKMGERIWAGNIFYDLWKINNIRYIPNNKIVIELIYNKDIHAEFIFELSDDINNEHLFNLSASMIPKNINNDLILFEKLLVFLGELLIKKSVTIPKPLLKIVFNGKLELFLNKEKWEPQQKKYIKRDIFHQSIQFDIYDKLEEKEYFFNISVCEKKDIPYYINIGNLILRYSHSEMTEGAKMFARVLKLAMNKLLSMKLLEINIIKWEMVIKDILNLANVSDRFEVNIFWNN